MDVAGSAYVKDTEEKIVVEDSQVKEVWREYFEKLLNEELDWNRDTLSPEEAVCGPSKLISTDEAISKMKSGKASGLSGVVAEMLKAAGEVGIDWVTEICNVIVKEGKIPVIRKGAGW